MKKIIGFIVMVVLLMNVNFVSAAPVGNIAKPILEKGDTPFKVGAELDFVTKRELEADTTIDELNAYMAKISCSMVDEVEVYCLLGAASGKYAENYADGTQLEYETDTNFAWGVGATVLLYEFDNGVRVGLDGRYRQSELDVDTITSGGVTYEVGDANIISGFTVDFSEWQVALGVSKEYDKFVPYGGIKYNDVEASAEATILGTKYDSGDVNSDDVFGVFIGCDFLPTENFSIGVEGRFIDEEAFSVRATYRF